MKGKFCCIVALLSAFCGKEVWSSEFVVRAQTIYTVSGPVLKNAALVIENGRIKKIFTEPYTPPSDAEVLSAPVVMPAFIDAFSKIGLAEPVNEESSEVTPDLRVSEVFSPWRKEVRVALWRGITLAHVEPGERNVVGGFCALVRTWGKTRKGSVLNPKASLKAVLGMEPTFGNRGYGWAPPQDIFFRRPTTRMAVARLFRDSLRRGKEAISKKRLSAEEHVLLEVVKGKLPLRVHAGRVLDIRIAVREKEKYGLHLILEDAWEAYKVADIIAKEKIPVVLTPDAVGLRLNDPPGERRLNCASVLERRGIVLAFGTAGVDVDLRLLASTAVRYGLSEKGALQALTLNAARILGIADQWGSIAPGKRADLVLLNGPPLSLSTRILYVIGEGRIVYPQKEDRNGDK